MTDAILAGSQALSSAVPAADASRRSLTCAFSGDSSGISNRFSSKQYRSKLAAASPQAWHSPRKQAHCQKQVAQLCPPGPTPGPSPTVRRLSEPRILPDSHDAAPNTRSLGMQICALDSQLTFQPGLVWLAKPPA